MLQVLATAGVASRRNCIDLVKQGAVKVNGQVVTDPATRVDPSRDVLAVQNKTIKQPTAVGNHYFAVNKPPGYICSNTSAKSPGKRAVDLLTPWLDDWQKRHPVSHSGSRRSRILACHLPYRWVFPARCWIEHVSRCLRRNCCCCLCCCRVSCSPAYSQ